MRDTQKANIAVLITASNARVEQAGRGPSIETFRDLSRLSHANGSFGVGSTGIVRDPDSNAGGTVEEGARGFPVQANLDPVYLGDDGLSVMGDFMSTAPPLDAFDNPGLTRFEPSRHLRAGVVVGTEIDQDKADIFILHASVERGGMLDLSVDVGAAYGMSLRLTQRGKPSVSDPLSRRRGARNGDMPGVHTSGTKLAPSLA